MEPPCGTPEGSTLARAFTPGLGGILLLALAGCAGSQRVRFEEPAGARVRIGPAGVPRAIPFATRLHRERPYALEVEFHGAPSAREPAAGWKIRGTLVLGDPSDGEARFHFRPGQVREAILEGRPVYARDRGYGGRHALFFKGSPSGIDGGDPEVAALVDRTRETVLLAAANVVGYAVLGPVAIAAWLLQGNSYTLQSLRHGRR